MFSRTGEDGYLYTIDDAIVTFEHMTSSFQARDAQRVLRILCKHFGKFPGQTLPWRWLTLEWGSGTGRVGEPVGDLTEAARFERTGPWSTDRGFNNESDLLNAIDYAVNAGWLIRRTASDETVIELTQAGYQWQADREALNASGKNVPRELLKLLKKRS